MNAATTGRLVISVFSSTPTSDQNAVDINKVYDISLYSSKPYHFEISIHVRIGIV